ncbi:DUF4087 domain-containing protein [Undibacterium sp. RuTC16W]|uniref:DUF4087 domain-containing protein n=1 Tax=Undibacterium sp. RuTC16W TaxID=3413048 RepID=UPI003BF12402
MIQAHRQILVLLFTATFLLTASASESADVAKLRCGWFHNPSPQNASLVDRDGEWLISTQGGTQADGDWPEFGASQWVRTNNNYGYGCACIKLVANSESHEVTKIIFAKAKPLSACRNDRALKKPAS